MRTLNHLGGPRDETKMTWIFTGAPTDTPHATRYNVKADDRPITRRQILELLAEDPDFGTRLTDTILAATRQPIRWETPPYSDATADDPAEFVLVESPSLDRPAESHPFRRELERSKSAIAVFPNLSGDATMIVPKPLAEDASYPHLLAFLQTAPPEQRSELWQTIGREMLARQTSTPLWLSTAGMGVAWLHVRIDKRPKYYSYQPYRNST